MALTKKGYGFFFLSICILLQGLCVAQNIRERDSLQKIVDTGPDDSSKVNALVGLGANLVQYQIKDAERHANKAIELAQSVKFSKGEAKAHLVLSRISRETSDYSNALFHTYTALKLFESVNNLSGV